MNSKYHFSDQTVTTAPTLIHAFLCFQKGKQNIHQLRCLFPIFDILTEPGDYPQFSFHWKCWPLAPVRQIDFIKSPLPNLEKNWCKWCDQIHFAPVKQRPNLVMFKKQRESHLKLFVHLLGRKHRNNAISRQEVGHHRHKTCSILLQV